MNRNRIELIPMFLWTAMDCLVNVITESRYSVVMFIDLSIHAHARDLQQWSRNCGTHFGVISILRRLTIPYRGINSTELYSLKVAAILANKKKQGLVQLLFNTDGKTPIGFGKKIEIGWQQKPDKCCLACLKVTDGVGEPKYVVQTHLKSHVIYKITCSW